MALWGRTANTAEAPKLRVAATSNAFCNVAIANTSNNAFVTGQAIGVFGANSATAASVGKGVSPGWILKTTGTGGRAGRVSREILVAFSGKGGGVTANSTTGIS